MISGVTSGDRPPFLATRAVHAGNDVDPGTGAIRRPIVAANSYALPEDPSELAGLTSRLGELVEAAANPADGPQPFRDLVGESGHDQKRYSKAGGIDGKQHDTFAHRGTRRTGCQDRAEDRADARSPAETERKSEDIGRNRLSSGDVNIETEIALHD